MLSILSVSQSESDRFSKSANVEAAGTKDDVLSNST